MDQILSGFLPQLLLGAVRTVHLAVVALLVGLVLGIIGAYCESSQHRWLSNTVYQFNKLMRTLPELLIIFIIYFAGSVLMRKVGGSDYEVGSFVAGVVSLSLIFGACAAQVLHAAFLAIPETQVNAGVAFGFTRGQIFRHILLPQAWRHALPGLGNLWLTLLKDTSLVSLIGATELMSKTQGAVAATSRPFTFYLAATVIYLIMTSLSQLGLYYSNKHVSYYI